MGNGLRKDLGKQDKFWEKSMSHKGMEIEFEE